MEKDMAASTAAIALLRCIPADSMEALLPKVSCMIASAPAFLLTACSVLSVSLRETQR